MTFVPDTSRGLAAWRAAVGDAVVDGAGRVCEDAPLDSLLVISWNMHLGDADMHRFIAELRNGCDARVRQDRGNAILSTLPLTNLKAVELPLVRQRRVAAMAEVAGRTRAGREWTLALASVHFENRGPGLPRDWAHGRARQARAFVANLPDSLLLAVGGDFNALRGSHEPAVRIVGAHFANSPPHQRQHTFVSYAIMRSHLDYLFFRCIGHHRTKYWRARERYGSDHYPIMGFVRVG